MSIYPNMKFRDVLNIAITQNCFFNSAYIDKWIVNKIENAPVLFVRFT